MRTRIIGEIGLNANGVPWLLLDTIRAFAHAGATDVKVQVRDIRTVYAQDFLDSPRESPWGRTQYDQKRAMEFDDAALVEAAGLCRRLKVDLSASCWDTRSLERFVQVVRPPWLKVASPFLTWDPAIRDPLLQAYADTKLPLIVSTGMSGFAEVDHALTILPIERVTLLQCTSTYPACDDDINLRAMETLRKRYGAPVGLSYHGRSPHVVAAAIGAGAVAVEVHVTLSCNLMGSDQSASWQPEEFAEMVHAVQAAERAMGSADKVCLEGEARVRDKLMRRAG